MAKATIMLVEDEAIVAKSIEDRLQVLGYEVCAMITSGEKAIELAGEHNPDLVLMDIKLQGKVNGIEAAEQIRARFNIPVVYLTAFADEDTLQKAKTTEPFGYILKPFEENALYSTIEMALYKYKMERKLKESEARYHAIVEDQVDLIYRFLPDGTYTFVNESYANHYGQKPEDMIGQNIMAFLPKEEKNDIQKKIQSLSQKNPLIMYEHHVKDRDGMNHWLQWIDRAIFDDKSELIELQSVGRDTTERRLSEEALKESHEKLLNMTIHLQSIREEERTKVAREIHDELGQALTALKMDLSLLQKKLPKDDKSLMEKTKSMSQLIDSTVTTVKKISSDLRPGLLDDLGLLAAIEWQAEEFERRTGIHCMVSIQPHEIKLDEKLSTPIFRIFQEALTNIARHAHATDITIHFHIKKRHIELIVKDNGRGITNEQIGNPKSFGIIGIRERAEFLGGTVNIQGISNKGTIVTLHVPIDA